MDENREPSSEEEEMDLMLSILAEKRRKRTGIILPPLQWPIIPTLKDGMLLSD